MKREKEMRWRIWNRRKKKRNGDYNIHPNTGTA
jgi:hypothetical protein